MTILGDFEIEGVWIILFRELSTFHIAVWGSPYALKFKPNAY